LQPVSNTDALTWPNFDKKTSLDRRYRVVSKPCSSPSSRRSSPGIRNSSSDIFRHFLFHSWTFKMSTLSLRSIFRRYVGNDDTVADFSTLVDTVTDI